MISLENIINTLKLHGVPENKLEEVRKSYNLADDIHKNQVRQSGEPYIIHPLNVAQNLLDMKIYDTDMICAALLHDTIEDAEKEFKKEDIERIINKDVAELVDGVTKISRMNFVSKEDQNNANLRKITNGLYKDVRIIIIKLADRLHNMRTLQYKKPHKARENAIETMTVFVPLAESIGAYKIKSELEDISLSYIDPEVYKKIKDAKEKIWEEQKEYLEEMEYKLNLLLKEKNINARILQRTKNICTTYKKIKEGYEIGNIYDLYYLKILVNEVNDCFNTLGIVHESYKPLNGRFKDYIYNPRTNLYQSLHTTVIDKEQPKITKVKIRTEEMDLVTQFGISALWNIKNGKSLKETQEIVRNNIPFVQTLIKIDENSRTDIEYLKEVNKKLFTQHVYIQEGNKTVEIQSGATLKDYIVQIHPELVDCKKEVLVNGKTKDNNYVLKNRDRIEIKVLSMQEHRSIFDIEDEKQKVYKK